MKLSVFFSLTVGGALGLQSARENFASLAPEPEQDAQREMNIDEFINKRTKDIFEQTSGTAAPRNITYDDDTLPFTLTFENVTYSAEPDELLGKVVTLHCSKDTEIRMHPRSGVAARARGERSRRSANVAPEGSHAINLNQNQDGTRFDINEHSNLRKINQNCDLYDILYDHNGLFGR